jgi:hypothetical protein
MIERPTARWRSAVSRQTAEVAAGTLAPDKAYAVELWPADFVTRVDAAFDVYDVGVRALRSPSDDAVMTVVQRIVMALNDIDEDHGAIETGEREELCEFIIMSLAEAGVDVDAIAARRGVDRWDLTDEWRDW